MTSIHVTDVTKTWAKAAALRGVSFSAGSGEFVALLGPSGCGKSTTLRVVAGLETADSGTVKFNGQDVTAFPPAARQLSMVFQSYALFGHLNVRENILFGLRVRRIAGTECERRLARATQMLSIGSLLDRRPAQLSGGQRQRVALARAIVAETSICLMDEPLSNLDAQLRMEMRGEIRELQRRLGMTMLYVTHDQTEAMTMADKVVLLSEGRVEQIGTPRDLYRNPGSVFAARFIGAPAMNLLRLESSRLRQALGHRVPHSAATLGVRPEAIRVNAGNLQAEVISAEYHGADSLILCDVAGERMIVRASEGAAFVPGDRVNLDWSVEDMHLFDAHGIRLAGEWA